MKNWIKSRMCGICLWGIMCICFALYVYVVFRVGFVGCYNTYLEDFWLWLGCIIFFLSGLRPCLITWWRFIEKYPDWKSQKKDKG